MSPSIIRTTWCFIIVLVVAASLFTTTGFAHVDRITATSLVSSAPELSEGLYLEWQRETIGAREVNAQVVRVDPGVTLTLMIPTPTDGADHRFMALRRMTPLHLQREPVSFQVLADEEVLFEVHGLIAKGGPWDSTVIPVPSLEELERVVLVNKSSAPIFISELLYFGDVEPHPAMDLYFLGGALDNESQLTRSIQLIPIDSAPGEGSGVGIAVNWPFMRSFSGGSVPATEIDMELGFQRALRLATDHDLKLNVKLTSDWGGWPVHIMDGLGGRFGDLEYQQIMFSPQHVDETPELDALLGESNRREYGLTIPNRWSSTPWLTYNHPHLSAFLKQQYATVAKVFDRLYEGWVLTGEDPGIAPLSTGNESLYWARENDRGMDDFVYSEHNEGIDRDPLWADFNPYVVEAALADGIVLDPTDGLDDVEREWLHLNLARHNQMLVNAMRDAQGASVLTIDADGHLQPITAPRDEIFTEPYGYPFYPLWDDSRPMMNVGIVEGARPGTQWYTTDFIPYAMRQREFGITANPNFEWTGIAGVDDALASLRAAYALGNEFVTFYNWTTDVERLGQVLNGYSTDFPVAWTYQGRLTSAGNSTEDLMWRQVFRPRGELQVINMIDANLGLPLDWQPESAVTVRLHRRVFLSEEPMLGFRVPKEHIEPLSDGWIRMSLPTTWLPADSNYVLEIQGLEGGQTDQPAVRIGLDMVRERGYNQLIQARGEASRLLHLLTASLSGMQKDAEATKQVTAPNSMASSLSWEGKNTRAWLHNAQRAFDQGLFEEALRKVRIADALILPARFALKAEQSLTLPGDMTVIASDSVMVKVEGVEESEVTLRVRHLQSGEMTYTVSGGHNRPEVLLVDDKDRIVDPTDVQVRVVYVDDETVNVISGREEIRMTLVFGK